MKLYICTKFTIAPLIEVNSDILLCHLLCISLWFYLPLLWSDDNHSCQTHTWIFQLHCPVTQVALQFGASENCSQSSSPRTTDYHYHLHAQYYIEKGGIYTLYWQTVYYHCCEFMEWAFYMYIITGTLTLVCIYSATHKTFWFVTFGWLKAPSMFSLAKWCPY